MKTLTINFNTLTLSVTKERKFASEKDMESFARLLIEDKFHQVNLEGINVIGSPSEHSKFMSWLRASGHASLLITDKEWDWDDIAYNRDIQRNQRIDKFVAHNLNDEYTTLLMNPVMSKYNQEVIQKGKRAIAYLQDFVRIFSSYGYDFTTSIDTDFLSSYKAKNATHASISARRSSMEVQTPCDLLKAYYSIRWLQDNGFAPIKNYITSAEYFSSAEIAQEFAEAKSKDGYKILGIKLNEYGMYEVSYELDFDSLEFDKNAYARMLYGDNRDIC